MVERACNSSLVEMEEDADTPLEYTGQPLSLLGKVQQQRLSQQKVEDTEERDLEVVL